MDRDETTPEVLDGKIQALFADMHNGLADPTINGSSADLEVLASPVEKRLDDLGLEEQKYQQNKQELEAHGSRLGECRRNLERDLLAENRGLRAENKRLQMQHSCDEQLIDRSKILVQKYYVKYSVCKDHYAKLLKLRTKHSPATMWKFVNVKTEEGLDEVLKIRLDNLHEFRKIRSRDDTVKTNVSKSKPGKPNRPKQSLSHSSQAPSSVTIIGHESHSHRQSPFARLRPASKANNIANKTPLTLDEQSIVDLVSDIDNLVRSESSAPQREQKSTNMGAEKNGVDYASTAKFGLVFGKPSQSHTSALVLPEALSKNETGAGQNAKSELCKKREHQKILVERNREQALRSDVEKRQRQQKEEEELNKLNANPSTPGRDRQRENLIITPDRKRQDKPTSPGIRWRSQSRSQPRRLPIDPYYAQRQNSPSPGRDVSAFDSIGWNNRRATISGDWTNPSPETRPRGGFYQSRSRPTSPTRDPRRRSPEPSRDPRRPSYNYEPDAKRRCLDGREANGHGQKNGRF